jgi:chromosomal replication initiation ATPase DnaA
VRELEGALIRLAAYASSKKRIDLGNVGPAPAILIHA